MQHTNTPGIQFEEMGFQKGYKYIAGVDEAGRGPLAGPVVAAACVLPRKLIIDEMKESKLLTSKKREELYYYLTNHPKIDFGIGIIESDRIDEVNILQASLEAMALAVEKLNCTPDYLLVDGREVPKTGIFSKAIIKGDTVSQTIAAASILAKVIRDQLMIKYHSIWPQYGFDQHKGYGTKMHLEALVLYGPCPIHRFSFAPVKSYVTHS